MRVAWKQNGNIDSPRAGESSARFSRELADEARSILWKDTGCDPEDVTTGTRPVIRLACIRKSPSFKPPTHRFCIKHSTNSSVRAGGRSHEHGCEHDTIANAHGDESGYERGVGRIGDTANPRVTAPLAPTVSALTRVNLRPKRVTTCPAMAESDDCGGRKQECDAGLQGVVAPDILEIDRKEIEEGAEGYPTEGRTLRFVDVHLINRRSGSWMRLPIRMGTDGNSDRGISFVSDRFGRSRRMA